MRLGSIGVMLLCSACGSSGSEPVACDDGETLVAGECTAEPPPCPSPGIALTDGSCVAVGIAPDACAEGFSWSDGACEPILPDAPCAEGTMAIPGETACRPVMDCPTQPWGGIDGGATPQWVDGSYSGNDSDGSKQRPWTTIGQAVAAAAPGSVVGIAAGTYDENVAIDGKALHLRGTCPDQVEIVGVPAADVTPALIIMWAGTSGSSFAGFAVSGPSIAIGLSGGTDVTFERLWIHDAVYMGLDVQDPLGPATAVLRDSLVERIAGRGLFVMGTEVTVERSVIRGTKPDPDGTNLGIQARVSDYGANARASLSVSRSLVSGNAGMGVFAVGSDASVDASVVRDTAASGDHAGWGIGVQVDLDRGERPILNVTRSALLDNTGAGASMFGATARVDSTLVRGTRPDIDLPSGVEGGGRGINIQDDLTDARSTVEIVASTIDQNFGNGVFATGSDLTVDGTLIADTQANDGRGINLQPSVLNGQPVVAVVRRTAVLRARELGVLVGASRLTLEDSVIEQVEPSDLGFGDTITALEGTTEVTILRSTVVDSGRSGLSLFDAKGTLTDSRLLCHSIDIAIQNIEDTAELIDGGGNECGCGEERHACKAKSASLEPPPPL
jgi:hypothetical protein